VAASERREEIDMRNRVAGAWTWFCGVATAAGLAGAATALALTASSAHALTTAPPDVDVRGSVVDAKTLQPIAGATVFVREWRALCDAGGRFVITLPTGRWAIEAAANNYQPSSLRVDACAQCKPEVVIALIPKHFMEEHVDVSASVNGGSDLVTTTQVRPVEVLNAAGAFENVFRVLQTLPGVTSTGEWSSRLSVRGGGPDQNMTVMDGIEIYSPYRIYGLVSAFNPETVGNFELSTGAFSAKYGDRLSSILTIDNRNGTDSTLATGSVGMSLTDGNAIIEGRLPGHRGSWLLTGRRTWYDLIAKRFTDDDLPSFNDLQGKLALDLGRGASVTLFGLRSRERSNMTFAEDYDSGVMSSRTLNNVAAATLLIPLGTRGVSRTIGALYENTDNFDLNGRFHSEIRRSNAPYDDLAYSFDNVVGGLARAVRDRSLRQELTFSPSGRHVLDAGFELHDIKTREHLQLTFQNRPNEGLWRYDVSHDVARSTQRFGAWLIDRVRLARWLDLEAGLRYDRSRLNGIGETMPRLSLTVRPSQSTRLRAAFGEHTQSPGYEKLSQADYVIDLSEAGRLRLANEHARHMVVGIERDLAPGLSARIEGFYKRFDNLIVGRLETPEEVQSRVAAYDFPAELSASIPRYRMITQYPTNDGRGRAYGFDVFLARRAVSSTTRLSGWLAYTYTSANRQAYGYIYPFEYEQPHALSAVASFRASQRLELSVTGRFTSGFPKTPPLGLYASGVLDTNDTDGDGVTSDVVPERDSEGRLVYAINYGSMENRNRARFPWYGRVDFRATFVPRWGKGRWRLYLDVINLLGRNNSPELEGLQYALDATQPRIVVKREGGFPFLPSFGVHVRF
jgi:TonB-dependent Receptor Plug Domain